MGSELEVISSQLSKILLVVTKNFHEVEHKLDSLEGKLADLERNFQETRKETKEDLKRIARFLNQLPDQVISNFYSSKQETNLPVSLAVFKPRL
jgi:hypothetical protein